MADNKMKIIRVLDIVKESDEDNPITALQIIEKLKLYGISAERKSVYDCIRVLIDNGYDINLCQDNKKGYFLGKREFEDWELKILIDAIWQSKFLDYESCKCITDKIKSMASNNSKKLLTSVTPIKSNLKCTSPSIKYYIDNILKAIHKKRKIKFKYTYIDSDLKRKPRRDGFYYVVNPYSLVWINERYYLICNYDKYNDLSYYRLDRMVDLEVLEYASIKRVEEIVGSNVEAEINEYVSKSFYQYGGEKIHLTMKCGKGMLDELYDFFGESLRISNIDEDNIEITVEVLDGKGLYYWLMQHGANIEVISPESVREELKEMLQEALNLYKREN